MISNWSVIEVPLKLSNIDWFNNRSVRKKAVIHTKLLFVNYEIIMIAKILLPREEGLARPSRNF